jgi:hypothetical protein
MGEGKILLYTVKKRSPTGMSLTKLSQAGNNFIIPGQGEFGKLHPGWGGKTANLFLQCSSEAERIERHRA